jgi:hypothetical protein
MSDLSEQQEPKSAGRPTDYNPEVASAILARVMAGESLRSICRDENMPARSTVHLWLAKDKAFSDHYVRACDVRADEVFDEMFEIADDGTNDWMIRGSGEDATEVVNSENVQRSRLRIDTRKWALARMNPKKYGEKIVNEVVGKDGGPIATTSIDAKKLSKAQLEALATINLPPDRS